MLKKAWPPARTRTWNHRLGGGSYILFNYGETCPFYPKVLSMNLKQRLVSYGAALCRYSATSPSLPLKTGGRFRLFIWYSYIGS